jgi:hypothetical protein
MKYLLLKENNPFATCNTIVSCAQERYCHYQGIDGMAAKKSLILNSKYSQMIC